MGRGRGLRMNQNHGAFPHRQMFHFVTAYVPVFLRARRGLAFGAGNEQMSAPRVEDHIEGLASDLDGTVILGGVEKPG